MLESLRNFFKKMGKKEEGELLPSSSDAAKERLHFVLVQDRVNVSIDFLDMMKEEIIEVIKKYIDIDEKEMDVRLTNQVNEDGSNGSPALYANIPIVGIKSDKKIETNQVINTQKVEEKEEKSSGNVTKITDKENKNSGKKSEAKAEKTQEDKKTNTSVKKVDKTSKEEENNSKKVANTTNKKEN